MVIRSPPRASILRCRRRQVSARQWSLGTHRTRDWRLRRGCCGRTNPQPRGTLPTQSGEQCVSRPATETSESRVPAESGARDSHDPQYGQSSIPEPPGLSAPSDVLSNASVRQGIQYPLIAGARPRRPARHVSGLEKHCQTFRRDTPGEGVKCTLSNDGPTPFGRRNEPATRSRARWTKSGRGR